MTHARVNDTQRKALIAFPHGIGDVIMLMPVLRTLYDRGFTTDLVVRRTVVESGLLVDCPYTGKLFPVPIGATPRNWRVHIMPKVNELREDYGFVRGVSLNSRGNFRAKMIAQEIGVTPRTWRKEVFIPPECERQANDFLQSVGCLGSDFVHMHTRNNVHTASDWNSYSYVKSTYPDAPILDTGFDGHHHMAFENINTVFALLKKAKYRVLSDSVMIHACDALGLPMDLVNYGTDSKICYPFNKGLVKKFRVKGKIQ